MYEKFSLALRTLDRRRTRIVPRPPLPFFSGYGRAVRPSSLSRPVRLPVGPGFLDSFLHGRMVLCGSVCPACRDSAVELEEYTDPYIRMAINGARMALADAGLDFSKVEKAAVVLATCNAGLNSGEVEYLKKYGFDCPEFDRSVSLQSEFYSLSKAVAGALKSPAQCWMVNTACSGSTAAIGLAEALIESGKCDVVLVGG